MRTIISVITISESEFDPLIIFRFYDSELNKFIEVKKIFNKEMMNSTSDLEEYINNMEIIDYDIIPDADIFEMYKKKMQGSSYNVGDLSRKAFEVVENYIKSIKRGEKLDDIGI